LAREKGEKERKKVVSKRGEGSSDTMELFPTTAYHAMRDIKGREGEKGRKKEGKKEKGRNYNKANLLLQVIERFSYCTGTEALRCEKHIGFSLAKISSL